MAIIKQRLEFLDFVKSYAILGIVVYHILLPITSGLSATLIRFGGAGVHAFILLSGFGLAISQRQLSLGDFYRRRLWRIYAPYAIFLTGLALLNLVFPLYGDDGLLEYLSHILLFKMFDSRLIVSYGYHLWFISTIIQLYILYPLLQLVVRTYGVVGMLVSSCLISIVAIGLVLHLNLADERSAFTSAPVLLWEFALGIYFGDRYRTTGFRFWQASLSCYVMLAITGGFLLAAFKDLRSPVFQILNDPLMLITYMAIAILCNRAFIKWMPWLYKKLCSMSTFAYELFLTHCVAIIVVIRLVGERHGAAVYFLLALSAALIAGKTYAVLMSHVLGSHGAIQKSPHFPPT